MVWQWKVFNIDDRLYISEKFVKMLFNGKVFKNKNWSRTIEKPKNPETNPETWYVNEKFLIMITYYISLKKSR